MSSRAKRRLLNALAAGIIVAGLMALIFRPAAQRHVAQPPSAAAVGSQAGLLRRGYGAQGAPELHALGDVAQQSDAPRSVTWVYDGDTIEVKGIGKVRFIGIDAMDGHNEDRMMSQAHQYGMLTDRVKHWAGRASEFVRGFLEGREVRLHYGPEAVDGYGRALAYVHVVRDGEDVDLNLLMLREGLAAAYRRFDHPRRAEYLEAERTARADGLGLWRDAATGP
ncbi:MAG: thermonuclease family protein [Candidatus Brocadiae bacterium]|nr:thermonuclease family protein [Candidatus Brocadiia bacterium]